MTHSGERNQGDPNCSTETKSVANLGPLLRRPTPPEPHLPKKLRFYLNAIFFLLPLIFTPQRSKFICSSGRYTWCSRTFATWVIFPKSATGPSNSTELPTRRSLLREDKHYICIYIYRERVCIYTLSLIFFFCSFLIVLFFPLVYFVTLHAKICT